MRLARHLAGAFALSAVTATSTALVGTAPASAHFVPAPCGDSARACVDLSENRAWLMDGGTETYGPVRISHGMEGYETPTGTSAVDFKDIDHRSSIYENAPMPYSVFFNGGIAFHEGDTSEQSHGCIRLSEGAAQTFYNTLSPGDLVQVVQ